MLLRHGLRNLVSRCSSIPFFRPTVSSSWLRPLSAGFATKKTIDIYPESSVTRKKKPETMLAIKNRLKDHLVNESKMVKQQEDSGMMEYIKDLRATMSQDPETQELVLAYTRDNYDIEVRINPEEVGEDEGPQENEEQENEGKEDEELEKEDNFGSSPHMFYVQLTSKTNGKKIMLQCTATADVDTRVESIKVVNEEGKFDDDELPFPQVSGELQDVIYDFLADVDVDERTAKYVHWRVEQEISNRVAASINRLKDFFD